MNSIITPDNVWPIWAFIMVGAAVSIYLEQNYKWAANLSGPVVALLVGMGLSNFKLMPTESPAYDMVAVRRLNHPRNIPATDCPIRIG